MVWSPPGHIRSLWILFGQFRSHLCHFGNAWEQVCLGVFRRAGVRGVWYRLVSGHGLESAWSHSVTVDLVRSVSVAFVSFWECMGTGVSRRVSARRGKRRLVSAGVWSWFGVRLVTFGHCGSCSVSFGRICVILGMHGNRCVSACFGAQG